MTHCHRSLGIDHCEAMGSTRTEGESTMSNYKVVNDNANNLGVGGRRKRALDVLGSIIGLVIASPIMLLTAVLIWIRMGRPLLFRQVRPGLHENGFVAVKFRTMSVFGDRDDPLLSDAERVTSLGEMLRKTSLDELPQLWNVLRGDMSLVGPRPLLFEFIPAYSSEQRRRHEAKPGITGLAQVSGRNSIPYSRRFELDVQYIDNWTLWLDLKILVQTLWQVIKMSGSEPVEDRSALDDVGLLSQKRKSRIGS